MPILHAYTVPTVPGPAPAELMFGVETDPAGPIPNACRLPMPRAGVLAQFAVAWQAASLDFTGTIEVLVGGAPTGKVVPMAGASGFALPVVDPVVAFVVGAQVSFRYVGLTGVHGVMQAACVVRSAALAPTRARIMGTTDPTFNPLITAPPAGIDHFETLDSGWNTERAGLAPLITGFLVPVPCTIIRGAALQQSNTLDQPVKISLVDNIAITEYAPVTYAPGQVGLIDTGLIAVPVPAGAILVSKGILTAPAVSGVLNGPCRSTWVLDVP